MNETTDKYEYGQPAYSTFEDPFGAATDLQTGKRGVARIGPEQDFESALTDDMRLALHDVTQAANVCEWCADRCIDHGVEMAECVRLCRDTATLASVNARFLARDSPFGLDIAEAFATAAAECADECARHDNPHCQECARVLDRAVDTTWRLVDSIERSQPGRTGW